MPVLTRGERPRFRITLEERSGRHLLERQPRYAVLVNGAQQGELYFNMTGYQGYLPTVHGSKLDIGELLSDNHLGRCRQAPWPVGLNGRRACPSGGQRHQSD